MDMITVIKTRKSGWLTDLLAGITGAVAGAPQAMAFAIIAGVSPVYGLYTAIVSTIVGALTSSSVYMTIAPTNALALFVGTTVIRFDESSRLERMVVLTLVAGGFQLVAGLLRLGDTTRFVSNAVMTGFLSGAGVLIILGQLHHLTGYEGESHGRLLAKTWDWLLHLDQSDLQTTLIGVSATVMIFALHHTRFKSIATLSALILSWIFIQLAGWDGVAVVRDMAAVSAGLPQPSLPDLRYVPELWTAALAIAVLSLVQSAGLSRNVPQPDGRLPDISRDFTGQGLANIVGSFFFNMPSGGSLSRTAVNISAGARSRMANVWAGVFVALILLVFGRWIEEVALAVLAGHLIVASMSLISLKQIRLVWEIGWAAQVAMGATFLAALLLPLEYSIYIGVVLSLGLYLYTSSNNLEIKQLIPLEGGQFRAAAVPGKLPDHDLMVLNVEGNLYFAAVNTLEHLLPAVGNAQKAVVIIRLRGNKYLGSTGLRLLERYAEQLEAQGGLLILCGVCEPVAGQLQRTGKMERFGRENVFLQGDVLLESTRAAVARARAWLAQE